MRKLHIPHARVLVLLLGLGVASVGHAESSQGDGVAAALGIFKSSPAKFQDYLVQDAAAAVTAAELAGVAPGVVQVMENTRDISVYAQGLSGNGGGGGFAITPARIKNPFPVITVEEYKTNAWARILAATTISYAQGSTGDDERKYRRRALSIASNWYPFAQPKGGELSDDPVYQSIVSGEACLSSYEGEGAPRPVPGLETGKTGPDGRPVVVAPDFADFDKHEGAYIKSCSEPSRKAVAARWYRPVVSLSVGSGDVALDKDSGSAVNMGRHATLALRYGRAFDSKDEKENAVSVLGWALYLSHKAADHVPVAATLGTSHIDHTSVNTSAARLTVGGATLRALIEFSNVKNKLAVTGDQTLKKAVGLEYQIGQSAWLHFRYGRRLKVSGSGDESSGMLSLTFGPEALQF